MSVTSGRVLRALAIASVIFLVPIFDSEAQAAPAHPPTEVCMGH